MNVDVIIDNECNNSKIVIYTDKMSDEISHIVDILKNENDSQLYGFIQDKLYFLNFQNIFLYIQKMVKYLQKQMITYIN